MARTCGLIKCSGTVDGNQLIFEENEAQEWGASITPPLPISIYFEVLGLANTSVFIGLIICKTDPSVYG